MKYLPPAYDPEVFQQLPLLEEAYERVKQRGVQKDALQDIRALFYAHKVEKTLGLTILHRHFCMSEEELLVEYGKVATPWLIPQPKEATKFQQPINALGGNIIPRSWTYHHGHLYPTEFGFNPLTGNPKDDAYEDISFESSFVHELNKLLTAKGLDDIFGLTIVNHENLERFMGVEKTVGRVSITVPAPAELSLILGQHEVLPDAHPTTLELASEHLPGDAPQGTIEDSDEAAELGLMMKNGYEAVWTFGCHQSLNNSSILPARICWACEGCKK